MSNRSSLLSQIQTGVQLKPVAPLPGAQAPAPFDLESPGDCVLKSSDGVPYKTHRLLLALASSVFNDMFEIPQAATTLEEDADLPVIDVSEPSRVLLPLLQLIHPATSPQITSLDIAFDLITVFDKYMMDITTLRPLLAPCFVLHTGSPSLSLATYALTWRLGLKDEAEKSSRYLHSVDLMHGDTQTELLARSRDIKAIMALWELRHRRELAMDKFVESVPLGTYRCANHQGVAPAEMTRLRAAIRSVMLAPFPAASDVQDALNVSGVLAIPPARAQPSSPFIRSTQPDASTTGPCGECRYALNHLTPEVVTKRIKALRECINVFPQTIQWPL